MTHGIDTQNLFPSHVAFIMDGNRRWAKKNNLPIIDGHKKGAEIIKKIELINQKILTREIGSGTLNTLQSYLDETKLAYEPYLTEVGSNETIKQAVISNIGIAMISEHCCINEIKFNFIDGVNKEVSSGNIKYNKLKWSLGKKNIEERFKLGDLIFVKKNFQL